MQTGRQWEREEVSNTHSSNGGIVSYTIHCGPAALTAMLFLIRLVWSSHRDSMNHLIILNKLLLCFKHHLQYRFSFMVGNNGNQKSMGYHKIASRNCLRRKDDLILTSLLSLHMCFDWTTHVFSWHLRCLPLSLWALNFCVLIGFFHFA